MTPDTPDDRFPDRLADLDAALAAGQTPTGPGPDPRLEQALHVLRLLDQERQRLAQAAPQPPAAPVLHIDPQTGAGQLGRFQLRRELGRGGHGLVFHAWDPLLQRELALKVPRPEMLFTEELRHRFVREARAAAGLDHPNIVPLYEAGEVGALSYLAFAYIPGRSLAAWLAERQAPVPWRQAARLVADLTGAVAYLHQRGVLHRDIKPGNVLLQPRDTSAPPGAAAPAADSAELPFVPRLTDFGLARLDEQAAPHTVSGTVLGTPAYMAPEQAGGRVRDIGPQTDVFSLGCVLYELLTGRPPFQGQNDLETLHRLATEEAAPVCRQRPEIPRDLETICLKCLEKAPARRYASAALLANDLQRVLGGQPIQARPQGVLEWTWRRVRRHPRTAVVLTAAAAVVVAAVTWAMVEMRSHSQEALARRRLDYVRAIPDLQRRLEQHDNAAVASLLAALRPGRGQPDLRGFEWRYLWYRSRLNEPTRRLAVAGDLEALAVAPDGRTVATGVADGRLQLWDGLAGTARAEAGLPGAVHGLVFARDGQTLYTGTRGGEVALRDGQTGALRLALAEQQDPVLRLALAPDGRELFAASDPGLRIWDLASQRLRQRFVPEPPSRFQDVVLSPDGRLYAVHDDRIVSLFARETRQKVQDITPGFAMSFLAFNPDGRLLAVAGQEQLALIDTATWQVCVRVPMPVRGVRELAFSPDGRLLAVTVMEAGPRVRALLLSVATLLHGQPVERPLSLATRFDNGSTLFAARNGRGWFYVLGQFAGTLTLPHPNGPVVLQPAGADDLFLACFDTAEELRWVHQLGGTGAELAGGLLVDGANNLLVVGSFSGEVDFDTGVAGPASQRLALPVPATAPGAFRARAVGSSDGFVLKLDATSGRPLSLGTVGGPGATQLNGVTGDSQGSVYVVGTGPASITAQPGGVSAQSPAAAGRQAFVARFDNQPGLTGSWLRILAAQGESAGQVIEGHGAGAHVSAGGWLTGDLLAPVARPNPGRADRRSAWCWQLDPTGNTRAVVLPTSAEQGQAEVQGLSYVPIGPGHLAMSGRFSGTLSLDVPGSGPPLRSRNGQEDTFLYWLGADGLASCSAATRLETDGPCRVRTLGLGTCSVTGHFQRRLALPTVPPSRLEATDDARHGFVAFLQPNGLCSWGQTLATSGAFLPALADEPGQFWVVDWQAASASGPARPRGSTLTMRHVWHFEPLPGTPDLPGLWPHVAWFPDGRHLAFGAHGQPVGIWPRPLGPERISTWPEEAWSAAFSPDGQTLAIATDNEQVAECLRLVEVATGHCRWRSSGHTALVTGVVFSPDGRLLATSSYDLTVRLWDAATGQEVACLKGHTDRLRSVAFSPDGQLLAAGGFDRKIYLWDVARRQLLGTLVGHTGIINALRFSPDGQTLASTCADGSVRLWDVAERVERQRFEDAARLWGLAFSPHGRRLAIGNYQGRIRLIDLATGQEQLLLTDRPLEVRALAFTADGQRLATAGEDGVIRLWDVASGRELLTLTGHKREVNALVFAPDGSALVSASLDGTVRFWWAPPPEE